MEVTFVEGRIVVIDNPIGVLTNNPDLNWHYENLKHYMHVTPYKIDNTFSKQFNLGNMNGTFGLPGGYTSGERFVRAAYLVHHLLPDSDDHPILVYQKALFALLTMDFIIRYIKLSLI